MFRAADSMIDRHFEQMKAIRMPDAVRADIAQTLRNRRTSARQQAVQDAAAAHARALSDGLAASTAQQTSRTIATRRLPRHLARRRVLAVAACAAALLAGALALSVTGELPFNIPGLSGSHGGAGNADSNGFTLTAYADGTPLAGAGDVVVTNELISSTGMGSWSAGDDESITCSWNLNLSITGKQLTSLDVSLPEDTENITLEYMERDGGRGFFELLGKQLNFLPDRMFSENMKLQITVPLSGKLAQAYEPIRNGTASEEDWDAFGAEAAYQAAIALSATPITLTATRADGSTVSHSYRFSPVEHFRELYRNDQDRFWSDDTVSKETFESAALFTIEQLS